MQYIWYKNNRVCIKSWDMEHTNTYNMTQEYYDDYIGNQTHHKGNLLLNSSSVKSLGRLKHVDGHLDIQHSKVTTLGNLEHVSEYLYAEQIELTSLGNLKSVGEEIFCNEGGATYELFMNSKFKDQVVT